MEAVRVEKETTVRDVSPKKAWLEELDDVLKQISAFDDSEPDNDPSMLDRSPSKLSTRKLSLEPVPEEERSQDGLFDDKARSDVLYAITVGDDGLSDAERAAVFLAQCLSMSLDNKEDGEVPFGFGDNLQMITRFLTYARDSSDPQELRNDRLLRFVKVLRWLLCDCDDKETVTRYQPTVFEEAIPCQKDTVALQIGATYANLMERLRNLSEKLR